MLPSDRVLQHQYQAWNYWRYADLIRDLLQAEKNLLLRIITNVVLGILLSLRSITMRIELALPMIQIQRRMVGPLGADAISVRAGISQRRLKRMVPLLRGIMCNTRHAELSSIQLRSAIHLSTS
jgi:hypothetical protein